jgi:A/G-specific adenine glycosylase
MLQQTTVRAAAPRWTRFLRAFPSLPRLARAAEDEVLAAWSGLGYYARARNLHAAAREIVRLGAFPETAPELEALPGFGPYTAAAVASIAFGERVAALDTNAVRVLSRLLGTSPKGAAGRRLVAEFARRLLPERGAGDHNQAVMELGATVCLPASPQCGSCPLRSRCRARRSGPVVRLASSSAGGRPRPLLLAAGLAKRRGRLLLVPDREMVAGHLTLPSVRVAPGADPEGALVASWPELAGREARAAFPAGRVAHAVLDRRYTVHLFRVEEGPATKGAPAAVRLASEAELPDLVRGSFLDKAVLAAAGPVAGPVSAARTRRRGAAPASPARSRPTRGAPRPTPTAG